MDAIIYRRSRHFKSVESKTRCALLVCSSWSNFETARLCRLHRCRDRCPRKGKTLSRTQHEFKVYLMCVPCNTMCSNVFTSYALVFKVQSMQAKKIWQLSKEVSIRLNQMFMKIQPSMCHWIVTAGTLRWWHLSKSTVISLRRSSLFTCLSWKHHI